MFAILFRVVIFMAILGGLLKVKKTRLRHQPARRTRISRHYGESTLWLERLVEAAIDFFFASATDTATERGASPHRPIRTHLSRHALRDSHHNSDPLVSGNHHDHANSNYSPAVLKLLSTIEERVNAVLEDSGVAAWADFAIESIGSRPPKVKALYVGSRQPTEAESVVSPTGMAAPKMPFSPVLEEATLGDAHPGVVGAEAKPAPFRRSTSRAAGGASKNASTAPSSSPAPSASMDIEAEVEYSGGAAVSLHAELSLGRGRRLPIFIRVGEVRYLRVHLRAHLSLDFGNATVLAPRQPVLKGRVWLESDPAFDMRLHTRLTRYGIRDVFLVPILAKTFLLRFVRSKLKRGDGGSGIAIEIPLSEDVVDGGEQLWSSILREGMAATAG